jgi:hypothetical protein
MDTPTTISSIEGGCLCEAIRYRVVGVPVSSIICHCNTCRRASGAPSVAWLTFPFGNFTLMSGRPQIFRSSPGVKRTFCASCGTPLTYESDHELGTIDVTTISLDDPSKFPPTREVWLDHKLAWEEANPSLDHCYQGSSAGAKATD